MSSAAENAKTSKTNEDEDDYLSMVFDDNEASNGRIPESSLQRTARLKREAAARAQQPRKRDVAVQAAKNRQAVLNTALDSKSNLGARMMAKMGFKEGSALGASENGLREPIRIDFRAGKSGIGMATMHPINSHDSGDVTSSTTNDNGAVKRNREQEDDNVRIEREAIAQYRNETAAAKRQKIDLSDYRERAQQSAEDRQAQAQLTSAMKVLETMTNPTAQDSSAQGQQRASLHEVPLLRRRLARDQLEEECNRTRQKIKARTIATRTDSCTDASGSPDPDRAFVAAAEVELYQEDPELEEFEALPPTERLEMVIEHLRKQYHYCFWCMGAYDDETMNGCPGLTEEEHG